MASSITGCTKAKRPTIPKRGVSETLDAITAADEQQAEETDKHQDRQRDEPGLLRSPMPRRPQHKGRAHPHRRRPGKREYTKECARLFRWRQSGQQHPLEA